VTMDITSNNRPTQSYLSPRMKNRQDLYKRTPDWKQKYKDRCRDRLKCGRTRLLEQFRGIQITVVDHVMKETAKETGLLNNELDSMLELFDEIRNELLEDFNEHEGTHFMMAEMAVETIPDDINQQQNVPCPGCSMPLSYGTDDFDYPTCSNCRIALSVSANVLADSYQEWFHAHAQTGCDWPPDVSVIPTPNNTGQVQVSCDGCSRSNIIPHLIVKRF